MIEQRREAGWTFVFLGANQDAFASSKALSMTKGATSNFVADARGMRAAWPDLAGSTVRARSRLRSGQHSTADKRANYLKGFDSAERDFERRKGAGDERRKGAGEKAASHSHHGSKGGRRRGRRAAGVPAAAAA